MKISYKNPISNLTKIGNILYFKFITIMKSNIQTKIIDVSISNYINNQITSINNYLN